MQIKTLTKPFLRWAGGKTWLTKQLKEIIPQKFGDYYEPFLGGASVFIHLQNERRIKNKAYLSDANSRLINAYKALRDKPEYLFEHLRKYKNSDEIYYRERGKEYDDHIKEAARFIFLNRTSFNGIYRENLDGVYNVPYGYKNYKVLFDFENMRKVSVFLKNSFLADLDFEKLLKKAKRNDFIFIDPPYTVAHENNGFIKYNQKIFSWEDQVRLRNVVEELKNRGVFYVVTNAYHKSIKDLYKGVSPHMKVERYSVIGGAQAKREKYHEILFTNIL